MSCSNALLFVAPVAPEIVSLVEHTLIFWDATPHNRQLLQSMPVPYIRLEHTLVGVEDVPARRYEGPGFCRPGELRDWESGVFK
jgi:hypothetical protein